MSLKTGRAPKTAKSTNPIRAENREPYTAVHPKEISIKLVSENLQPVPVRQVNMTYGAYGLGKQGMKCFDGTRSSSTSYSEAAALLAEIHGRIENEHQAELKAIQTQVRFAPARWRSPLNKNAHPETRRGLEADLSRSQTGLGLQSRAAVKRWYNGIQTVSVLGADPTHAVQGAFDSSSSSLPLSP